MRGHDGPAAIGHVRYATCGGDDRSSAQPFEREHGRKTKWFAFAFNGQLANYQELKRDLLEQDDYHLTRDTDTEIIMHSLSYELQGEGPTVDWVGVFNRLADRFDGAYNIVLLTASGDLVVARDPMGFRPALHRRARPPLRRRQRERSPGQPRVQEHPLARAGHPGGRQPATACGSSGSPPRPKQAHCFFEWIYFANVASTLDDRSVYLSRAALGEELARLEDVPLDADTIVVPVPDTAKAAADAMAFALKVPSVEGLMRNRYVGRTFIEGNADRAGKARLKYTPLPEVLAGKRVLLVEDSIVRSTTMRALVHEIRDRGGAREIHLRVACPPIVAPCFYGIDMSRRDELFATRFIDLPDEGISDAAQQRDGPRAGGRQPPLPAGRGDRTLGQPPRRPPLSRLHHREVPHPRRREALVPRRHRDRPRQRRRGDSAPTS